MVESLTLSADSGLPLWLAVEGRLIQIDEAQARPGDTAAREIAREMAVLQAVVAIPLISHGELVGILTLGQRITGGAYGRGETEILFNLGDATSPPRSATSACTTCSSTRRNSTSGSSRACRAA